MTARAAVQYVNDEDGDTISVIVPIEPRREITHLHFDGLRGTSTAAPAARAMTQ
ncbi:MAG: hypothetical protein JO250_05765 [Armatimonadetes bacterium]|nr:hypothetical protein [Armatimonadota bacterium]